MTGHDNLIHSHLILIVEDDPKTAALISLYLEKEGVKAILRRGRFRSYTEAPVLSSDGLVLDTERHQATLSGRRLKLTPHEYKLLLALMTARGRVLSRRKLLMSLYPNDEAIVIDRAVDVHIGKLRQKIESDAARPRFILTVRGSGYRFAGSRYA